jgi:putative ABC transport system permease protein
MVSQNFVTHYGKQTGDTFTLDTPTGRQTFEIVGVVVDFASPVGVLYFRRDLYEKVWRDSLVTCFTVEVAPGFTPEQVRDAIDTRLGGLGLVTTMNAELRAQLGETMDESFGFTRAIEWAALGVGLLGLLSTLLMSLLERLRELGMLRAIGMSRAQLGRLIFGEAILLGVLGGGTAAALGAYVAHLFVVSALATQLGWQIQVYIPWSSLATTVGAGLVVGLIAGFVGARRMARLEIRAALEAS